MEIAASGQDKFEDVKDLLHLSKLKHRFSVSLRFNEVVDMGIHLEQATVSG
jgi:hypothetical protein